MTRGDQIRKGREYADSKCWSVLDGHIYTDESITSVHKSMPTIACLHVAMKSDCSRGSIRVHILC